MFGALKNKIKNLVNNITHKKEQETQPEPQKTYKTPQKEEETREKEGFKVKTGLKTKIKKIVGAKLNETDLETPLWEFQLNLLEADVALQVAEDICKQLKEKLVDKKIPKEGLEQAIISAIREILEQLLDFPTRDLAQEAKKSQKPYVVMMVGPNGAGKTTTIAKITTLFKKNNLSTVWSASDTFRAASMEQLQHHAEKLGVKVIKHDYGADPAAVGYDAVKYAKANKIDTVIIDTAGRQQTNINLVEQMKKIARVVSPNIKLYVGESISGNAIVEQVKSFNEAISLDGVVLTKIDIDEKGGTAISIASATGVPILYLSTGQGYEEFETFEKQKIIQNII